MKTNVSMKRKLRPSKADSKETSAAILGSVHQGDCIAGMASLEAESVDLVFADPPFNIGFEYDTYEDSLSGSAYLTWCQDWMKQIHRVLKANGTFWLAIGDEYAAELKVEAQNTGFHCRSWVIWYYTFGVHCTRKFTRSHAHLFHFVKDPSQFTFNAEQVKVPSARQLVYNDARAAAGGRMPDDTFILRPQDCADGFTPDEDTWYFPRIAGTFKERAGFHGCQMPERLLGRIIEVSSNRGDVVLDPFSGSATTLAVAKKLERNFFGFELSSEYTNRGNARLASVSPGDELDGSPEPKASAPRTHKPVVAESKVGGFREQLQLGQDFEAIDLLQAFRKVHRGYSLDRTLADPLLRRELQKQCDLDGVPGDEVTRCRILFRLRKTGAFARHGIETTRETTFSWEEVSQYIFASEIAWKKTADLYEMSLDEILCDSVATEYFDSIATAIAPGFSPLEYRWGALKLRKEGRNARQRALKHKADLPLPKFDRNDSIPINKLHKAKISNGPGIYAVLQREKFLYIAEAPELETRLLQQFDTSAQQSLYGGGKIASVVFAPVERIDDYRLARTSLMLSEYSPRWNIVELLSA